MGMPITTKGQVTIPKPMRDHMGLAPGSRVEFVLDAEGQVILQKAGTPAESRFARVRRSPSRRNALTTEEIMKLTRGEEWGEALVDAG